MAKYVQFNGVKHQFSTEKEKKALEKEAQAKGNGYLVVDGCFTYRGLKPQEVEAIFNTKIQ